MVKTVFDKTRFWSRKSTFSVEIDQNHQIWCTKYSELGEGKIKIIFAYEYLGLKWRAEKNEDEPYVGWRGKRPRNIGNTTILVVPPTHFFLTAHAL